ncbi:DUF2213 domain-containing protein [Acinetobacter ursingii]|mgnify:CR=1 FL=1|uniref:DUF2213 domain-containing protein n=1 Tax=Acinetobacter ursingii TaxID=108980 RepID=UPI0021CD7503|nr:DUF2213 domain-containing protein [Acinetobacter ursingii]MCU4483551.1 DUF2213 domain-containing protein [Acinetobacter ursingii]MCU4507871.1 DUF2213 domain-containing protein [Acinetobacter ursingii]
MAKKKTKDRKTLDRSNIFTTGLIGRTRETTPEGYLLCRDVRLARIGDLTYADGEVPVAADMTGQITISRGEDVLFNPLTIASCEGKPITDDHPEDWVTPKNWKNLSKGTGHNVHRGDGEDSEFMMGDLLVMDEDAITAVMGGKVEISLGYDADYIEVGKGKGLQSNIRINHIALVDKGRCGSRCSIGDSLMSDKTKKKKVSFADRIRNLVKTKDAEEAEKLAKAVEDEAPDIETEDDDPEDEPTKTGDAAFQAEMRSFMKTMDKRMSAIEKKKTKDSDDPEKETEDDDPDDEPTKDNGDLTTPNPAKKLNESGTQTYTGDSLKEVMSRAEILSPGYRMPTFDSVNNGKAVLNTKRSVLKQAHATEDGQKAISPFVGANPDFDKLPAHTIDAAFAGASELIKQQNNMKGVRSGISTKDFGKASPSPADINAKNRAFYANKG